MTVPLQQSVRWCHELTKRTAGNFYYSFLTLRKPLRMDMCVLYAFMRVTDDLGDDPDRTFEEKRQALTDWTTQTCAALAGGEADHPLFPALFDLVTRHRIPHPLLFAVIDGMLMDQQPVTIASLSDLEQYCYHVAGVVGLCCIHIWGFEGQDRIEVETLPDLETAPEAYRLAIDCGFAFQLTNMLRDVGEDVQLGRVYLPEAELIDYGVTPSDLIAHRNNDAFRALMRFETERAEAAYRRACGLFGLVHPRGHAILSAMIGIYGGLLREIRRRNFDVLTERVSLPKRKKLWIVARSLLGLRPRSF